MVVEVRLFADYHQLHAFDEGSTADLGAAWTDEADHDQFAVAGDAIAVGTAVNVDVAVRIELLTAAPEVGVENVDHVAEGSLEARSGRLVVMGCTDYEPDAARYAVPAGWLRLRVSRSNVAAAAQLGIDSDDDPATMERVRIQVWPAPQAATVIHQRWQSDAQ